MNVTAPDVFTELTISHWNVPGIGTNSATTPADSAYMGNDAPEYYYYVMYEQSAYPGTQFPPNFDAGQVSNITNDAYAFYGLTNTYNAKSLYFYYATYDQNYTENCRNMNLNGREDIGCNYLIAVSDMFGISIT